MAPLRHVIIIGAGISGLTAGLLLRENGFQVTIVEAAERIGGRIHTVGGIHRNDPLIEKGAQLINEEHSQLRSLCEKYDIELLDLHPDDSVYNPGFLIEDSWISSKDFLTRNPELKQFILDELERESALGDEPLKTGNQNAALYFGRNISEYLDLVPSLQEEDREAIIAYARDEYGCENSDDISAEIVFNDCMRSLVDEDCAVWGEAGYGRFIVKKGTEEIIRTLQLKFIEEGGRIFRSSPATEIGEDTDCNHIYIRFSNENQLSDERFSHAIVTVPPWMIAHDKQASYNQHAITIDKSIGQQELLEFFTKIKPGHSSKIILQTIGPLTESNFDVLSLQDEKLGSFFVWNEKRDSGDKSIHTTTLYVDRNKINLISEEDIMLIAERIFPELGIFGEIHFIVWNETTHPYIQGAYGVIDDPSILPKVDTLNNQKVIYASTDISTEYQGFMEGAVRSAQDAVQKILTQTIT
jgi:hypothetical protein